jgi:hypothetical protein
VIFCDWLDVTFAPSNAPYAELNRLLLGLDFEVLDTRDRGKKIYRPRAGGRGVIEVRQTSLWDRVSASGASCAALRDAGAWLEYLTVLSDQPHKVTRLDAALDLPVDGADLVESMHTRYPAGVNLGRKMLTTSVLLAARPDGRQTGTWYAGYRSSARLTARVYDKAWEVLCKTGVEVLPCGRIEITARKDYGATLRDAGDPVALFWEGASPAILQAPEIVPMRPDPSDLGWRSPPRAFDAAVVLRRRIENLAELDALALVADDLGPGGRQYMLQLLRRRISTDQPHGNDSAPDVPASSACA